MNRSKKAERAVVRANAEVTRAILHAERQTVGTAEYRAAWRDVAKWEQRIADLTEPESLEGEIARRGVVSAREKAARSRTAVNQAVLPFQGAELNLDRTRRYRLWRPTGAGDPHVCVFVMLNPSTADEGTNDPTVNRCVAFARSWGYGRLEIVNLFSLRTSSPKVLKERVATMRDSELREEFQQNVSHINVLMPRASRIVCAWGNDGRLLGRDRAISDALIRSGHALYALGVTRSGAPKHPSARGKERLPPDTVPQPFSLRR